MIWSEQIFYQRKRWRRSGLSWEQVPVMEPAVGVPVEIVNPDDPRWSMHLTTNRDGWVEANLDPGASYEVRGPGFTRHVQT